VDDGDYTGNNLLARWERELSDTSNMALQLYWDHASISSPATEYERDTIDIDFQHRFQIGDRHEIVWGLGYRGIYDNVDNTAVISTPSARQHVEQKSAFLQDEISLIPDTLLLTLGSKIEPNDYTGTEFQPTARLSWSPGKRNTLWASYTGAVRTPSRSENDLSLNLVGIAPPDTFITIDGSTDLESETLEAYEIGWRIGLKNGLVLDMTAYYHNYNNLLAYEATGFNLIPTNHMDGESYGFETALEWRVNERWKLQGTYTYAALFQHLDPGSPSVDAEVDEGAFPSHLATVRASWSPTDTLEFDASLRYVDNLVAVGIDRFVDLDLRAAWRPRESFEISIRGRNLLDAHRAEFATDTVSKTAVTEVRRSVSLEFIYRF
jgi:iron complex outermembrane receptor protein